MRAAVRASSRNIATNCGSRARCGWIRLIQTSFSNPPSPMRRARKISAIPPVASFATSVYLPNLRASGVADATSDIRRTITLKADPIIRFDHQQVLARRTEHASRVAREPVLPFGELTGLAVAPGREHRRARAV